MTRVGLSAEEEKHYLLLLEGDISDCDLDLESSDDENNLENTHVSRDNEDIAQKYEIPTTSNISFEVEYPSSDEEDNIPLSRFVSDNNKVNAFPLDDSSFDEEDNVPLSKYIGETPASTADRKRETLIWEKKDIPIVHTVCNAESAYDSRRAGMTPLAYFKLFCDDEVIDNMVHQTNLYSVQKTGSSVNTCYVELCQYLGIHIISGIIKMPSYRMYWAQETRIPAVADVMSRNRFEKLRTMFHINDNSEMKERNHPDYDKLFKVRPFIDALLSNFSNVEPEEYNCVDEIMIPFKGRSSLKQYVKNKPHKWGIKTFARAGISGIIYDFEIYVGKGTVKESTELGISGDIVTRLSKGIPKNQNFKLFMDNWFTSFHLLRTLKESGILACGTVRVARMPKCNTLKSERSLKDEGRGSFDFVTEKNQNIIVCKWYDNKCVHVASTYKGIMPVTYVKRWSTAEKKYIEIQRPNIIQEYNTYMGGVDLNDMLVSLYRVKIGVKRYYLRIIFHLIDICIVNAWLLYRRDCSIRGEAKYKKLLTFRSEIGHALLQKDFNILNRKRGRPSGESRPSPTPPAKRPVLPTPIDDVRYDSFGHWPVHLEPKKRCRECKTAYARIGCSKCSLALCLTKDKNCFQKFHNK